MLKAAREPANALGSALAKVGASAAKAAVGLFAGGGLLAIGSKYALDAVAFKRDTMASLEAVEGSKTAAESAFATIKKFVDKGFDENSVLSAYTKLRKAGFDAASTKVALAGALDVGAHNFPNAAASIDAVTGALVEMQREGKLTTGMLDSIAAAGGPSLMQVAKHIKALKGMTEKQARATIDGGGINGNTGQLGVMKAI